MGFHFALKFHEVSYNFILWNLKVSSKFQKVSCMFTKFKNQVSETVARMFHRVSKASLREFHACIKKDSKRRLTSFKRFSIRFKKVSSVFQQNFKRRFASFKESFGKFHKVSTYFNTKHPRTQFKSQKKICNFQVSNIYIIENSLQISKKFVSFVWRVSSNYPIAPAVGRACGSPTTCVRCCSLGTKLGAFTARALGSCARASPRPLASHCQIGLTWWRL